MSEYFYWRRWYVYFYYAACWPGMFLVSWIGNWGIIPSILVEITMIGLALTILFLAFWSWFGYYSDAKHLKETESDWVPIWWLWSLLHIILTPFAIVPIYLIVRTVNTGFPPHPMHRWTDDSVDE